jgi:hypothetical protein
LLGFHDLGRFEKLAWSVPIDFEGIAYLIEYRKFGVGVLPVRVTSGKDKRRELLS